MKRIRKPAWWRGKETMCVLRSIVTERGDSSGAFQVRTQGLSNLGAKTLRILSSMGGNGIK